MYRTKHTPGEMGSRRSFFPLRNASVAPRYHSGPRPHFVRGQQSGWQWSVGGCVHAPTLMSDAVVICTYTSDLRSAIERIEYIHRIPYAHLGKRMTSQKARHEDAGEWLNGWAIGMAWHDAADPGIGLAAGEDDVKNACGLRLLAQDTLRTL